MHERLTIMLPSSEDVVQLRQPQGSRCISNRYPFRMLSIVTPSNYNSGNLCRRFCLSVYLKFDFQENRSHDSLQTRPMCCPETCDVHYDLSLYGCIQLLELNVFSVVFATTVFLTANPTVAPSCD